jgi:hypothetical protein
LAKAWWRLTRIELVFSGCKPGALPLSYSPVSVATFVAVRPPGIAPGSRAWHARVVLFDHSRIREPQSGIAPDPAVYETAARLSSYKGTGDEAATDAEISAERRTSPHALAASSETDGLWYQVFKEQPACGHTFPVHRGEAVAIAVIETSSCELGSEPRIRT